MAIFQNTPLWVAVFAIVFAQLVKIPVQYVKTRRLDWALFTSTGSMPSSHSACVCALATAVGFESGLDSTVFALAVLFAVITMYDATGVRFQAGQHAAVLNKMREDLKRMSASHLDRQHAAVHKEEVIKELKTLLGHKPNEVIAGALTGVFISFFLYTWVLP